VKRLFVDTGVWIAATNRLDRDHEAAATIMAAIRDGEWVALTTDYIIAESLNFVRRKTPHPLIVASLLEHFFGSPDGPPLAHSVLRIHSARFARALERYQTHFDAGLSFTDWTSVVCLEEQRIDAIATFDGGFEAWATVVGSGSRKRVGAAKPGRGPPRVRP
jgi:predicted nucleic acid-binding protein